MGTVTISLHLDVVIPRIVELGLVSSPNEACGIVVPKIGDDPRTWVHELRNRSPQPCDSYAIDPVTVDGLLADLNAEHVFSDVLIWHTHPQGNAGPSRGDLDAKLPGLNYLVVALPYGEAVMF
jgi:proteasome lid subunit RPN8/RPN11